MNIYIKDADQLLEQSGNIAQLAQNILRVKEDLLSASNRVSNAWASDTVDKESYLKVLTEDLAKIDRLGAALRVLSNTLIVYAEKQKRNNSNESI